MKLVTFRLRNFGAYEYQVYEKLQKKFSALPNRIAHGGHNTTMFNEIYSSASVCPIGQI